MTFLLMQFFNWRGGGGRQLIDEFFSKAATIPLIKKTNNEEFARKRRIGGANSAHVSPKNCDKIDENLFSFLKGKISLPLKKCSRGARSKKL